MYRVVKEECLSIINQGCNQLGEFEDTFRRLCQDDVTAGNESIWEIPFSAGRGRVLFDLGVRHKDVDQYTKQAKGGTVGPTPIAFYKYDPQDKRRNVTCVPYFWEKGVQVPNAVNQWYFGKYRYEWMNRIVTSSNDDGVNWLYMRLADVYLMAAEAINELDGPQAAAPYLKPILDRALPADKRKPVSQLPPPAGTPSVRPSSNNADWSCAGRCCARRTSSAGTAWEAHSRLPRRR